MVANWVFSNQGLLVYALYWQRLRQQSPTFVAGWPGWGGGELGCASPVMLYAVAQVAQVVCWCMQLDCRWSCACMCVCTDHCSSKLSCTCVYVCRPASFTAQFWTGHGPVVGWGLGTSGLRHFKCIWCDSNQQFQGREPLWKHVWVYRITKWTTKYVNLENYEEKAQEFELWRTDEYNAFDFFCPAMGKMPI